MVPFKETLMVFRVLRIPGMENREVQIPFGSGERSSSQMFLI
jgi:hypothetical protein